MEVSFDIFLFIIIVVSVSFSLFKTMVRARLLCNSMIIFEIVRIDRESISRGQ